MLASSCSRLSDGDIEVRRAFEAGAHSYLLKSMPPSDLLKIIRQVHGGKKHVPAEVAGSLAEHKGTEQITQRELDVLRHLAGGTAIATSPTSYYLRRNSKSSHQAHHGETRRQRSDPGTRYRFKAWLHRTEIAEPPRLLKAEVLEHLRLSVVAVDGRRIFRDLSIFLSCASFCCLFIFLKRRRVAQKPRYAVRGPLRERT